MSEDSSLNEDLLDAIFMKQDNEIVRLLDAGAEVNGRGKYGNTPLYHAVSDNNPQAVKILLERGANVHEKNDAGQSILSEAAHSGLANIARILLDHGADVNAVCNKGHSALIDACRRGGVGIDVNVCRLLLSRGAKVDHCCDSGFSALWWAIEHKHLPLCKLLVEHGVTLKPDRQQRNALHWHFFKWPVKESLNLLIQVSNKESVNLADQEGQTPLHLAARLGHENSCKQLLEAGADPLIPWNGKMAQEIAVEGGFPQTAALIRGHADAHLARKAIEGIMKEQARKPSP